MEHTVRIINRNKCLVQSPGAYQHRIVTIVPAAAAHVVGTEAIADIRNHQGKTTATIKEGYRP